MSANIDASGKVTPLEKAVQPSEQITGEDAKDAVNVARAMMRILRDVAQLKRRWMPRRVDFEGLVVDTTGTKQFALRHNLGSRVRWWPVDWTSDATVTASNVATGGLGSAAANGPALVRVASDDATITLVSYAAGTVTIRVEESG